MNELEQIVLLDRESLGADLDLSELEESGQLTIYERTDPSQTVERIQDASILISNKVVLGKTEIIAAKKLKLICIAATGTNNVDLKSASEAGIAVCNVAGYSTESVVQHTFAMLFQLKENLCEYDRFVKSGMYSIHGLFTKFHPFTDLSSIRWGIVGMGTIGRRVAKVAATFGAQVAFSSLSESEREEEFSQLKFEDLIKESDIISIHSPLNQKSLHLFNYDTIIKMKKSAVLLNVGRGGIVVEEDLARALNEGRLSGAAIDVFEQEPPSPNNPLFSLNHPERILFTPHIAWASIQSRNRLMQEIVNNIRSFKNGEKRNRLD